MDLRNFLGPNLKRDLVLLEWYDIKWMTYWHQNIYVAGYLIPKGWKVMPLFRNIHQNPKFFSDPQIFNPSRFEVWVTPDIRLNLLEFQEGSVTSSCFLFIVFLGCPETQYIYAFWQRSACLPRKWARKTGDADYDPSFGHQIQVLLQRKNK